MFNSGLGGELLVKQAKMIKVNGIKLNKSFARDQKKLMQQKQQLLKQAKKKQAKREEQAASIEVTSEAAKAEIKKLKQKLASKQREFLKVKNENLTLEKQHREDKQELHDLRSQQQNFSKDIKLQREKEQAAIKTKEEQLERQAADLAEQQAWLKENGLDPDGDVHQVIATLSDQNEYFAQIIQTVMDQNQYLYESRKDAYKLARKAEKELKKVNAGKEKYDRKLARWKKQSEIDRQRRREAIVQAQHTHRLANVSIETMISELSSRLSTTNIDSYRQLNSLVQKYDQIFDNFLTANSHADAYRYGYVEKLKDDGKYSFLLHDINHDQTNTVKVPSTFKANLGSNMVVRCQRNSLDQWEVDQVYQTISTSKTSLPKHHHHRSIKRTDDNLPDVYLTDKDELLWLKSQKLVLVGNKYSVGFLNELKKYCQVETFDAYEGREHQIFKAMRAADLVFILIGSVPHFITEYTRATTDLGKDSAKVQTFEVPAKYDGVIRLHYLYVNRKRLLEDDSNGTD
ncbi:hypothetical protein [Lactobacillus sp. HT06-2]|uniref:hypothetical protein n=1 Tax=Lactobacillus sp. HT06-2 TaxID=2080222 RepID=UPI000CD9CCF9|nr:hypothetical protein [Lactobacillus sp. HT06-2]